MVIGILWWRWIVLVEFTFPGPPVPYVRMNSQNLWTERVQNYLAYKRALSTALQAQFPQFVDKGPDAKLQKKERAAWLKAHRNTRYHLSYFVYEEKEKGDFDNYGKVISDALQDAGLIVNDKKIKDGAWAVRVDPEYPRIAFSLAEVK